MANQPSNYKAPPYLDGRDEHERHDRCGGGPLGRTMNSYAEVATMHGVYYVFETKYGRLSSAFWILVCLALIGLGIGLTYQVRFAPFMR